MGCHFALNKAGIVDETFPGSEWLDESAILPEK